jgi:hypothetical protein
MSLWEDFLNNIAKPVGKAIGEGAGSAVSFLGKALQSPAQAITGAIVPASTNLGVSKFPGATELSEKARQNIAKNMAYEVYPQAQSNDLMLKASMALNEKVFSKMTRSVGTAALLTDPNSDLYEPGEFEKGFQVTDIKRAWKRTEEVSAMQALTKSFLLTDATPLGDLQNVVLKAGNIDVNKINLWDDADIQKNYVDNPVGRYYTGLGDFVVGNAAIYGGTSMIAKAGLKLLQLGGLSTKAKTASQFESEMDEGIIFRQTNGAKGKQTVSGDEVYQLAQTDDVNLIQTILIGSPNKPKYTNNDNLVDLIRKSDDPAVIRDYILADKGYLPALERLATTRSSELAELSDFPSFIRAKNALDDDLYHPQGEALARIRAAFDDSIAKNPDYVKVRDAFFNEKNELTVFGREGYFPIEPKFGTAVASKVRGRTNQLSAAAVTRDFSKVGGIAERILGSAKPNGLQVRLVRFVGSYKPLGYVTFSGARTNDGLVELDAFFDDLITFRNGQNRIEIAPNQFINAADYRNAIKARWIGATSNIERKALLDELDEKIGEDIARTLKIYSPELKTFVQDIKNRITQSQLNVSRDGFAMDHNGRGVITDPYTQSQLVDSHRMVPWNIIEKELIRAASRSKTKRGAMVTQDILANVMEQFNKYWSFDVLARPMYIPKQSIAEPVLSTGLATGFGQVMAEVPNAARNFMLNNRNRVMERASKVLNAKELAAVNRAVEDVSDQLDAAIQNLDNLMAEADSFFEAKVMSPATVRDNQDAVKASLRAASRLVDDLELELRDAVKPYVDMPQVPTIANLERRVKFIESQTDANFKAKNASVIANAKSAIGAAKGEINTLMPDSKRLSEVYANISKIYDDIDNVIIKDLGEARYQQAVTFGKSEAYKKRYYGKDVRYRMVNGQWMPIESLFDENLLGTALRAEFENGRTVAATYLNELTVGTRLGTLMRKGPKTVTDVSNPLYFEELAWFANRGMRNDPLVKQVLSETPDRDILKWALSPEGRKYANQFGEVTEGMIPDFVRDRIGFVKRYLPDAEARALVLKKEVTSVELQKILSKDLGRLSPIHPIDFNYNLASEVFGVRGLGSFETAVNNAMGKIWRMLTSPENPIRWNYAENRFADIVAQKADRLARQGVPIDVNTMNALRPAATREALQDAERTFYTVRRQNRALFAARAFVAFPTATLNAFYRYGRFAIKNPARFAGFMHSYHSMFQSFGVDKYGNPTDDVLKVTHLLVPGTKELGLFDGRGVLLNARSIGFLLNWPTPSFITAVPVAYLYEKYPDAEQTMKDVLGPSYDVLFPYGPPAGLSGAAAALVPGWARDFYTYASGNEGRTDYLSSVKSVANYYRSLEEMGLGKFPGMDQIRKEARELYRIKAQWSFASIFGVPAKVETRPMDIFEQYYDILVNKYRQGGVTIAKAKELAGQEFLATINPNFPLDRITFKGATAKGFVPPTLAAWNRVMVDNPSLIKKIENNGLETLGLLTMDLDENREDFSLSVYRLLKDPETKLPTGTRLNEVALTPEQEETARLINRGWTEYWDMRDRFEKKAIEIYGVTSLRKAPQDFQAGLREYGNTVLKEKYPLWWKKWRKGQGNEDESFAWASSMYDIVNDENFMKKYGNTKLWSDVKDYVRIREAIASVYSSLPAGYNGKSKIREAYLATIDTQMTNWHPKLQEVLKRYFDNDMLKTVR